MTRRQPTHLTTDQVKTLSAVSGNEFTVTQIRPDATSLTWAVEDTALKATVECVTAIAQNRDPKKLATWLCWAFAWASKRPEGLKFSLFVYPDIDPPILLRVDIR